MKYEKRITTNVKEKITNQVVHRDATFVINPSGEHYLYRGDKIKPEHFKMMFPVETFQTPVYL